MRKVISAIGILAVVVASLLSSCATKEDIEGLQGQIDELKTGKISTIEQQVSAIQASIASLQTTDAQLTSLVSSLQLDMSNIKADLSSKENALSDKIIILNRYVDEELGKSRDWAKSTFATLEQYQSVLTELAGIKESVKSLDTELRAEIERAISASETSMKGWVNEQLSGYYTIAQMDAKLKSLSDADASMLSSISKLESDLDAAKTELTEAYTKAIFDAITKHDGKITSKIAAEIKAVTDIVDALEDRVASLEGMIQSVVILPAFPDGTVMAYSDGVLSLNCVISPVSSTKGLTASNFEIYATGVVTKAVQVSSINVSTAEVNESTGAVHVLADISSQLAQLGEKETLSVALYVKSGISDYISPFMSVTVMSSPYAVREPSFDGRSIRPVLK